MTIRHLIAAMWLLNIIVIGALLIAVAPAEPKSVTCAHVERGHCVGYTYE